MRWAWRHSPASRSTSSGSVTSVNVAGRSHRNQQQLVAATQQVHLLTTASGGAAEDLDHRAGQATRPPFGPARRMHPGDDQEKPSTTARRGHRSEIGQLVEGFARVRRAARPCAPMEVAAAGRAVDGRSGAM